MDKSKIDYTLYLCTDRGLMSCETIEQSVEEGVKWLYVQVTYKGVKYTGFVSERVLNKQ